jgi:hypothetical protein
MNLLIRNRIGIDSFDRSVGRAINFILRPRNGLLASSSDPKSAASALELFKPTFANGPDRFSLQAKTSPGSSAILPGSNPYSPSEFTRSKNDAHGNSSWIPVSGNATEPHTCPTQHRSAPALLVHIVTRNIFGHPRRAANLSFQVSEIPTGYGLHTMITT